MGKVDRVSLFVASPGDVPREREAVRNVCDELNADVLCKKYGKLFDPQGWEEALPGAGRPQALINHLVRECDIFVCIFHRRFGTPSGEFDSGTAEEFWLAYEQWRDLKKPHILFYFKSPNVNTLEEMRDPQLQKVLELKEKIETDRILLFDTFATAAEFREKLIGHLKRWVVENPAAAVETDSAACTPREGALEIPSRYCHWLDDHCRYMELSRLMDKSRVIQVRLPELFISLLADDPAREKQRGQRDEQAQEHRAKPRDIETLIAENPYLVIDGLAGSGKTTLAKHLCHNILRDRAPENLKGFLPVLVFLKDFTPVAALLEGCTASAATAEKALAAYFETTGNGLDHNTVKAFCGAGKALLLIDGLDEIDDTLRELLVHSLADFRIKYRCSKMVLSGRPHGVDDVVAGRFGDRRVSIQALNMEQVQDFITRWFKFVYAETSIIGRKTARGMIAEIKAHPDIDRLIDNPLMLTAICILYHDGGELPGQRAALYKKFLNNMFARRFSEPDRVQRYLQELARTMHTGRTRNVDCLAATDVLAPVYPRETAESQPDYRLRLQRTFGELEPNCGLLTLDGGQYTFRHHTFQEFLTAAAILNHETDFEAALDPLWEDDWYREVVLLCVGLLSIENMGWVRKIVHAALAADCRPPYTRWRLAAQAVLDIDPGKREGNITDRSRDRLNTILAADIAPKLKAETGEILGWLGDPRDLRNFVPVEGGNYTLSTGEATIEPFELGRYPVTNDWFAVFVNAGGYENRKWWSTQGCRWLEHTGFQRPRYWDERKWRCPNHPVVGVCWYEADAFCRWLTLTDSEGRIYRVPTDQQWETAAAGREGREYPWGGDWEEGRCNSEESKIGRTSAVGIFSGGSTLRDIADMVGNVWEWTRTDYHAKKDREDFFFDPEMMQLLEDNVDEYIAKLNEKDRLLPSLRGGSWDNARGLARCAARSGTSRTTGATTRVFVAPGLNLCPFNLLPFIFAAEGGLREKNAAGGMPHGIRRWRAQN